MKRLYILCVLLIYSFSPGQNTITTTTRWTDLGQDPSGVQMYVSFSLLGKEIALEPVDSSQFRPDATTRCRYRLSNFSDQEVLVSSISISLYSGGEKYDTYYRKKSVLLKPWQNHYGAFLTPKLREANKVVTSADMNIRAKVIQ